MHEIVERIKAVRCFHFLDYLFFLGLHRSVQMGHLRKQKTVKFLKKNLQKTGDNQYSFSMNLRGQINTYKRQFV